MRHSVSRARRRATAREWLNLLLGLMMMLALIYGAGGIAMAALSAIDRLFDLGRDTPDMSFGLCIAAIAFGLCWLAGAALERLNR